MDSGLSRRRNRSRSDLFVGRADAGGNAAEQSGDDRFDFVSQQYLHRDSSNSELGNAHVGAV